MAKLKIVFMLTLSMLMLLLATSCGQASYGDTATAESTTATTKSATTTSESTINTDPKKSESVEYQSPVVIDRIDGLDNKPEDLMTLRIPPEFALYSSQAQCDQANLSIECEAIRYDFDGANTYVMSEEQHKRLMKKLKSELIDEVDKIVKFDEYPDVEDIETDAADFSIFTIYTKDDKVTIGDTMVLVKLYRIGERYAWFDGYEPSNIHADFINYYSGEVIRSADSNQH